LGREKGMKGEKKAFYDVRRPSSRLGKEEVISLPCEKKGDPAQGSSDPGKKEDFYLHVAEESPVINRGEKNGNQPPKGGPKKGFNHQRSRNTRNDEGA